MPSPTGLWRRRQIVVAAVLLLGLLILLGYWMTPRISTPLLTFVVVLIAALIGFGGLYAWFFFRCIVRTTQPKNQRGSGATQPTPAVTSAGRLGGNLPSLLLLFAAALIAFAVPHWWPTAPRGFIVVVLLGIWLLRYAWFRKAALTIAVVAVLAVFVAGDWETLPQDPKNYPGYKKQIVGAADTERSVRGPSDITTVKLETGGFHGPIRVDPRVSDFEVAHSRNPGDWISVWCGNQTEPHTIHPADQEFDANEFRYCFDRAGFTTEFYVQGRGEMTIRALSYKNW